MKAKLNWKKTHCDDNSAHWYSAKVPVINWEYIVDKHYNVGIDHGFVAGLYFGKYDDDITRFSNKFYKTEKNAMNACEKHLLATAEKFTKWINKK